MTVQLMITIVGAVISALIVFLIFYVREIKTGFSDSQKSQDRRIEKIEDKLEKTLDELPERYVYRDDFIRWTIGVDKKIDDLNKMLVDKIRDLKAYFKELINKRECENDITGE